MAITGAMCWLAAALAMSTSDLARGDEVTWPGCSTSDMTRVVSPGHPDATVTGLRLYYCNFTSMSLDSLKSYPSINSIRSTVVVENILASNRNLFHNAPQLQSILLNKNDLSLAPDDLLQGLETLREFSCNYCSLRSVPLFITQPTFPDMTMIQLDYNSISRLDNPSTLVNVVNLELLAATGNFIEYIHEDLLKPLKKIKTIYLGWNKLSSISEVLFQNKSSIQFIDLSHNLIEHIPLNAFLGTDLRNLYLNGNRLTYLQSDFISNLMRVGIRLNIFHFYGNPWSCGCLNQLLIKVKKLNIDYEASKYDGRHPECFITDSFLCHSPEMYQNLYDNVKRLSSGK